MGRAGEAIILLSGRPVERDQRRRKRGWAVCAYLGHFGEIFGVAPRASRSCRSSSSGGATPGMLDGKCRRVSERNGSERGCVVTTSHGIVVRIPPPSSSRAGCRETSTTSDSAKGQNCCSSRSSAPRTHSRPGSAGADCQLPAAGALLTAAVPGRAWNSCRKTLRFWV